MFTIIEFSKKRDKFTCLYRVQCDANHAVFGSHRLQNSSDLCVMLNLLLASAQVVKVFLVWKKSSWNGYLLFWFSNDTKLETWTIQMDSKYEKAKRFQAWYDSMSNSNVILGLTIMTHWYRRQNGHFLAKFWRKWTQTTFVKEITLTFGFYDWLSWRIFEAK